MKLTPKTLFLIIIAAAILIPLLVFGWNELQKQPIDIVMYGAEIKVDGTVIQETQFRLKGYLTEHSSANELTPYEYYLEPITFKDIPQLKLQMESYDSELILFLTGNIHAPNYYGFWHTYSPLQDAPERVELYWCNQFCCCVIKTEGRYFVGSIRQEDTVQDVLARFSELELN